MSQIPSPTVTMRGPDAEKLEVFLFTQWFPPEPAPIGYIIRDLGVVLAQRGWNVTIVTGYPNHPSGQLYEGYKKKWLHEEFWNNLRIWRCYLWTSAHRTFASRVLASLTFTLSSAAAVFFRGRPDVLFALLQPLMVAGTLPVIARLKGAQLVFNVQDLHPDAPIRLGLVKNPWVIRALRWLEREGYASADALTVICESFKRHCLRFGVPPERVEVIENWIDLDEVKPESSQNRFRAELGLSDSDFVVLYAGTLGLLSGAESIVAAAALLSDLPQIKFAFVGEGACVESLKTEAAQKDLRNVQFAPFQPRSRLSQVQAISDVSVVSLKPGHSFTSVPSKALGYMAAGRAIIAAVDTDSETALLVRKADCGIVVPPGDPAALAAAIRHLLHHREERLRLANNGRDHVERHFSNTVLTGKYAKFFESLVEAR